MRLSTVFHLPLRWDRLTCSLAICGFLYVLALPTSGLAATPSAEMSKQIAELQAQIDALKIEYGVPTQSANASSANPNQQASGNMHYTPLTADAVFPPCPPVAPPVPADPKFPTVRLTGFFHADAAWFHQGDANKDIVGDIQDGADFRRARLAAVGDVWNNVGYSLEMDFGFPGRPSFMDVWFEVKDEELGNFRFGHFRQAFGMDVLTSARELTFIERGLPSAFCPFRQIGMMYYGHNEDVDTTWAVSGFRFPTDFFGGNIGDSGGYGGSARLTHLLVDNGDDGVVHTGAGYVYIDPANDFVQYRNQPEVFIAETGGAALVPPGVPSTVPFFVDTDLIPTEHVNLVNGEVGSSFGSLHTQAEIYYTMVSRLNGDSVAFHGAYAQAGYILTGEVRPYNKAGGVLGRIVPENPFGRGGMGAWEVAARWSYLDLNDDNIQGGKLNDVTLGLNWYLNKFTKFQFNYIHAFLNSSSATFGPVVEDTDANIFAVRGQLDF